MNFIDVLLTIARFLRQTVVVLLNPCMQQVPAVESGQHKMRECWKRVDAGSAIGFALGTGSRLRDACCGVSDTSTVGSEGTRGFNKCSNGAAERHKPASMESPAPV